MPFIGKTACYPWLLAAIIPGHKQFGALFATLETNECYVGEKIMKYENPETYENKRRENLSIDITVDNF